MDITATQIPDIRLFTPTRHRDDRGWLAEVWRRDAFRAAGMDIEFAQENQAFSAEAGTLRGLHFQIPPAMQGKLVRVTRGSIFDVAVDIRVGSPHFGRHVAVQLDDSNGQQMWIPPGFAHGYLTLLPNTEVVYALTAAHSPPHERGIRWNDPQLAINWPSMAKTILSARDQNLPTMADLPTHFRFG